MIDFSTLIDVTPKEIIAGIIWGLLNFLLGHKHGKKQNEKKEKDSKPK